MTDDLEIDLTQYAPADRGFTGGRDNCMHGRFADWDGEDDTRDLDICATCGARRVRRWK